MTTRRVMVMLEIETALALRDVGRRDFWHGVDYVVMQAQANVIRVKRGTARARRRKRRS